MDVHAKCHQIILAAATWCFAMSLDIHFYLGFLHALSNIRPLPLLFQEGGTIKIQHCLWHTTLEDVK